MTLEQEIDAHTRSYLKSIAAQRANPNAAEWYCDEGFTDGFSRSIREGIVERLREMGLEVLTEKRSPRTSPKSRGVSGLWVRGQLPQA